VETVQDWNQIEKNLLKLDGFKSSVKSREYYLGSYNEGRISLCLTIMESFYLDQVDL
jgi:hypothetical protein